MMRHRSRTSGVGLIATTLVMVALAGCGSSGSGSASNAAGTSTLPASLSYLKGLHGTIYWNQSGGELQTGFDQAFVKQFEHLTGVNVVYSSPCCDYAKLKAMHDSGNMQWDMMEVGGLGDLINLAKQGLVQKFAYTGVNTKLFPPDLLSPWGYDYGPSAAMLIWRTDKWPMSGKHPTTALDIFDTKDFPGKRCLYGAEPDLAGTLEDAELAAGIPLSQIYPINLKVAFGELDKIRNDIVWWQSGAQSIQYVLDGTCDLGITWNGRPALHIKAQPSLPIAGTFKDAMMGGGYFAIPAGAPNAKAAEALMRFYLQKSVQVNMCDAIAYCMNMPGVASEILPVMQKWVPLGSNLQGTYDQSGPYWAANLNKLTTIWTKWLATGQY